MLRDAPKCKRCNEPYYEEDDYDSFETGLCYHCFEDSLEEYEERKRERIARENEY
jgi:formylmethanofuran dehydrogenase subunit E